jgi:hypothetical protein
VVIATVAPTVVVLVAAEVLEAEGEMNLPFLSRCLAQDGLLLLL